MESDHDALVAAGWLVRTCQWLGGVQVWRDPKTGGWVEINEALRRERVRDQRRQHDREV